MTSVIYIALNIGPIMKIEHTTNSAKSKGRMRIRMRITIVEISIEKINA